MDEQKTFSEEVREYVDSIRTTGDIAMKAKVYGLESLTDEETRAYTQQLVNALIQVAFDTASVITALIDRIDALEDRD